MKNCFKISIDTSNKCIQIFAYCTNNIWMKYLCELNFKLHRGKLEWPGAPLKVGKISFFFALFVTNYFATANPHHSFIYANFLQSCLSRYLSIIYGHIFNFLVIKKPRGGGRKVFSPSNHFRNPPSTKFSRFSRVPSFRHVARASRISFWEGSN